MNNPSSPGLALIAESARLLHFQVSHNLLVLFVVCFAFSTGKLEFLFLVLPLLAY